MTYPDNEIVTNTYKPQLLLNSVTGTSTYVQPTAYDEAGRIKQRVLGVNKITSNFGYFPWNTLNGAGRLQTVSHSNSSQSLQAFTYGYSAVGDILSMTVTDPQYNETHAYTYDALSRLTSAVVSGGPANYNESYAYNATTSNLASKAGVTYTYDPNHPHAVASLSNGRTYQYDLNGNQVTRNIGSDSFILLYDAENRLVEVKKNGLTIATFTYDGDGKRVKSVIGGETALFVGRHYEVANGSATKYYFAGDQRIAMRKNGTLYYLLGDHLGSTSIVADASGNKISEMKYRAWGEVRYSSGAPVTDYTFTGQYSDSYIKLMWYGSRWYDPDLARWTQPDPIVPLDTQGIQAWDRYAYVNNNPVTYTDPSGHCIWDLCITETSVLVVLAAAATAAAISAYYAAGGPEAVTEAVTKLGEQAAYKLRSFTKSTGSKPLTDDEQKHVDKLTKGIDEFLKDHPDLPSEAEAVSEGEALEEGKDHINEAKQFAHGLENSIEHLQSVRDKRNPEAQQAIDDAIAHSQEILEILWDLLGGW